MTENVMKQIQISQVVVNIGIGEVGDKVDKAVDLVEKMTGKTAVKTESSEAAKGFGKRSGLNLGAKTTLRGEEAREFLEKVLPAVGEIDESSFQEEGNFSFGISEYIDVPGVDYDADIGMMGFEVAVNLERPGYRVKKRDYKPTNVGKEHKVTAEDAKNFVTENFDVEVKE